MFVIWFGKVLPVTMQCRKTLGYLGILSDLLADEVHIGIWLAKSLCSRFLSYEPMIKLIIPQKL